ncbi:MAG: hypothetical protein O2783_03120 [Chloroflexi bacterium]|nr:hypothetical protein [Chloroflexota bacterium]
MMNNGIWVSILLFAFIFGSCGTQATPTPPVPTALWEEYESIQFITDCAELIEDYEILAKVLGLGASVDSTTKAYMDSINERIGELGCEGFTPLFQSESPSLVPSKTWHQVARWQGKATKNTETFQVTSNEWRISWTTEPGDFGALNFQIYVYLADGTLAGIAANVIGTDSDASVMRGAGQYYLTINTGQPYGITVDALD